MSDYVELHCHSCFSMLDGASTPEALLDRAQALGITTLAITDHDGLYGVMRFSVAARERGIQPIIGAELMLDDESHLVLLAENREGYANLCWLISQAQLTQSKGNARLPLALLRGHAYGLIGLTACRQGLVARPLLADDRDSARVNLDRLRELLTPGSLYVEIQHHLRRDDADLVGGLANLAEDAGVPLVATNNVHHAERAGHRLADVLTAIRHNVALQDAQEWLWPNSERHLKSDEEMTALFAEHPRAVANTAEIAERCRVDLSFRREACPPVATAPRPDDSVATANECLAGLCRARLAARYEAGGGLVAAEQQMHHELAVIAQAGLAEYFMLVREIVEFAQAQRIQVRGRGSAASSIVAFVLGITNVDPLAHGLLFERFLSLDSRVMPDIDLDVCSRRREEVIQHIYAHYGADHVGMVANYVTYRSRSAVRDVGKALGMAPDVLSDLAKRLRGIARMGIEEAAEDALGIPDGVSGHTWRQFLSLCAAIQGLPRHLSIHVGGMVITGEPLTRFVPLERATMPGRVVVQWDKDSIEDSGLIKTDILSLRTLAAIDETLRRIEERHRIRVDLDRLPLDDPAVYDQLCRADTVGAFQVESRAQIQSLVKMRPEVFGDIIVEVAIIRPGPLQGNMVYPFFQRRMGLARVTYPHPLLEPILKETLGVIVYQEQVIRVAVAMGGFTAGEADMLRRAMSRHRSAEEMAAFRQRFVAGALAQGVPGATAEQVFTSLEGFAAFGFCKSHAVAFAKTSYDTLWLRAHYPAEYYCSLLNNQPMGFYAPRVLVRDALRHGVKTLAVHIQQSLAECSLEGDAIRLGLGYVDGLGEMAIERLLAAREERPFEGLADFCRRTQLPRKLVERVILAKGMACWEADQRKLLWELGSLRYQVDALPMEYSAAPDTGVEPMTDREALLAEYGTTGLSAAEHLMAIYREHVQRMGAISSAELARIAQGDEVSVAGLVVVRQAPPTARNMVFMTLEDEYGLLNIIVRPKVFELQKSTWCTARVILVWGRVERFGAQTNVMATRALQVL